MSVQCTDADGILNIKGQTVCSGWHWRVTKGFFFFFWQVFNIPVAWLTAPFTLVDCCKWYIKWYTPQRQVMEVFYLKTLSIAKII